jgi:hypothetical protein
MPGKPRNTELHPYLRLQFFWVIIATSIPQIAIFWVIIIIIIILDDNGGVNSGLHAC